MDLSIALLTLLHVLIPVYWLGGDLGAFYGSTFMTDPKRSVAERMMALKILNNIDMAPRTTLILALPTGFALAWAKGWLDVPAAYVALVVVAFLAWLVLAWIVHLQHGGGAGFKKLDIAIRYLVLVENVDIFLRSTRATEHLVQGQHRVVAGVIGVVAGRPIDRLAPLAQREVVSDRYRLVVSN